MVRRWGMVAVALALEVGAPMAAPLGASPVVALASSSGTTADASAQALLARINTAAQMLNYEGVFVFQRGAVVQSSRVVHFVENGDDQYQKVDNLDGNPRSVVQHGDDLFTFIPETHTVILDRRKSKDYFPALFSAGMSRVLSVYSAIFQGMDRVAGINCRDILLKPIDGYRFAYRLSVDPVSGMLIRAQTLDDTGAVLEQVAFSQLQINQVSARAKSEIVRSVRERKGWRTVRAPLQTVDMAANGWHLDPGVPGFETILELRRPMAARDAAAAPVPVDQVVFSDGVTAVSLFIEPTENSNRQPSEGRSGATHVLAQRKGSFWFTLIGEVPAATLQRMADSVHR